MIGTSNFAIQGCDQEYYCTYNYNIYSGEFVELKVRDTNEHLIAEVTKREDMVDRLDMYIYNIHADLVNHNEYHLKELETAIRDIDEYLATGDAILEAILDIYKV